MVRHTEADLALAALTDYAIGDVVLHNNGRRARVLGLPANKPIGAGPGRIWVQWLTPRYGGEATLLGQSAQSPVFVARHNLRLWHAE